MSEPYEAAPASGSGPPVGAAPARLPRYGDRFEFQVEALDAEGHGLGRVDVGSEQECTVRVRGGLPGARVAVSVIGRRRRLVDARLEAEVSPSPLAVPPRCPHFGPRAGPCGGCTTQHLDYDAQLRQKQGRVRDALASALPELTAARPELVEPVLGMASPWHYRNKMDFTFGARRWRTADEAEGAPNDGAKAGSVPVVDAWDGGYALGLHVPGQWSKVLDVHTCAIAFEGADALLATVRRLVRAAGLAPWDTRVHSGLLRHLVLRRGHNTGETMVHLVTAERAHDVLVPLVEALVAAHPEVTTVVQDVTQKRAMVAFGEEQHILHGPGTIEEQLVVGGRSLHFSLSARSFFQTNTAQAERLFEVVRQEAFPVPAARGVLYDLYCGAGTIGLCLADLTGELVGFESVEPAVEDARRNAERNGVDRARFVHGDVLDSLAERAATQPPPDVVVVDPPRAGLHPRVPAAVAALGAGRVVYVSCNPTSGARDVALLLGAGYQLERVRPVDLFPHTPHVETVFSLRRHPGGAT